jgi:hypothetical protein
MIPTPRRFERAKQSVQLLYPLQRRRIQVHVDLARVGAMVRACVWAFVTNAFLANAAPQFLTRPARKLLQHCADSLAKVGAIALASVSANAISHSLKRAVAIRLGCPEKRRSLTAACCRRRRIRWCRRALRGREFRQPNQNGCACVNLAYKRKGTAMGSNDFLADRQTQPNTSRRA